jgi:HEAT repeat protein
MCARVLAQIEPLPISAVPALQAALNDEELGIQVNIAASLCAIPGHVKETIPVLVKALKDRTFGYQAVAVLGKAGPEAKEALLPLLDALQDQKKDHLYTIRIGSALEQIAGREGVESIVRKLAGADKWSRPQIVEALSQTGPAGVAPLVQLTSDENPTVRAVAVRLLGQPGRSATEVVPTLVKSLQDKDPQVLREAVMAVGQLGSSARAAIPALTEILKGEKGADHVIAAEALAYVKPGSQEAVSALAEMVADRDLGLRQMAIMALGRIGPEARGSLPALTKAHVSANVNVRLEAAVALAHVGGDSEAVLPELLEVILEKNHPARVRALEALSRLGSRAEPAVSTLVRVLWEEGPARVKAAEVLGRIGPPATMAVPALTNLLKGSEPDARVQAALALWKIDRRAEEAVPVLVTALNSSIPSRQAAALLPPGRFGARSNVPPAPPCQQAAEALAQMGPVARAAVPALSEILRVPQLSFYSPYYALALVKIDRQAAAGVAVPMLVEALDGKRYGIHLHEPAASSLRKQAASVLGQIGEEARDAIPALTKALGDADVGVRQQAAKALGDIGTPARQAVPSLRKALMDRDEAVRSEANEALRKIGA